MSNKYNYVGNGWSVATQYGEIINLQLKIEELNKLPVDEYGNVKLSVMKRKDIDPKSKSTHNVVENTYKKQVEPQDKEAYNKMPSINVDDMQVDMPF